MAALLGLIALAPGEAQAAACCVSATSYGIGRLTIWEEFACGLQLGHARVQGQWDTAGKFQRIPAGYSEGVSLVQPWAILRINERLQLQAWAPVLLNDRRTEDDSQFAGGLGDVGVAARIELLAAGQYVGLPALAVIAGGLAPTGRRVEQTSPPLFAGTTGRGAWGGSLALELEYAFLPWFIRMSGGVSGFLPFERTDTGQRQRFGPLLQASVAAGRELGVDWLVGAVSAMAEWEGKHRIDGAQVKQSEAHLYTATVSLSVRATPHWTIIGTGHNSVWPDGGGENRDARVGFILGIRYGYF